jgi:hypothetical protein
MNTTPETLATLTLSHYTRAETVDPISITQSGRLDHKPRGLWVSVDGPDDWPAWCRDEMPGAIGSNHLRVTMHDDARILHLSGKSDLVEFTTRYGQQAWPGAHSNWIQWADVARDHQGIIIAPYCWPARLDPDTYWYYSWDCASGCIWDAAAIAKVSPADEADS